MEDPLDSIRQPRPVLSIISERMGTMTKTQQLSFLLDLKRNLDAMVDAVAQDVRRERSSGKAEE